MKRKNIKEVNIQDPSPGDLVLGDQDLKDLDQGIIKIKKGFFKKYSYSPKKDRSNKD